MRGAAAPLVFGRPEQSASVGTVTLDADDEPDTVTTEERIDG